MKKKLLFPILGAIGLLFAIMFISTSYSPPPLAKPAVEPSPVPFKKYIGGAGLTEPNSEAIAISTHIPGIVTTIMVKADNSIKKGDPLFIIEDREAKELVTQTEAMLTEAEASLKDAEDQYAIITGIKDERAISQDERNRAQHATDIARARVAAAEAELEATLVKLDLHTVRAPVDGTIMTMNLRVGEYAATGPMSEPLLRIGNLNPMHIRVDIDENDAWRFDKKAKAIAFIRGNPKLKTDLHFIRTEPYVRPKISLTGSSMERVDTRVLQIIYEFDPGTLPVYAGQQMDIYIEDTHE